VSDEPFYSPKFTLPLSATRSRRSRKKSVLPSTSWASFFNWLKKGSTRSTSSVSCCPIQASSRATP